MKKLILALALGALSAAHAQDKTYTLTVNQQDLQVISAGLDELQRKVSEPLVEKLQKELLPQFQQAAATGGNGPVSAPAPAAAANASPVPPDAAKNAEEQFKAAHPSF